MKLNRSDWAHQLPCPPSFFHFPCPLGPGPLARAPWPGASGHRRSLGCRSWGSGAKAPGPDEGPRPSNDQAVGEEAVGQKRKRPPSSHIAPDDESNEIETADEDEACPRGDSLGPTKWFPRNFILTLGSPLLTSDSDPPAKAETRRGPPGVPRLVNPSGVLVAGACPGSRCGRRDSSGCRGARGRKGLE